MKINLSEFFELCWELLDAYGQLKYVSKEDEQDYLVMFEDMNKRTKRILGRGSLGTIMFTDDETSYRHLPQKLTIYRGYHEAAKREGISWSLSKTVAEDFAHISWREDAKDVPASVVTGTCLLKDVLAYTNDRGEQEIIINPKKVTGIRNIPVGEPTLCRRIAEPLEDILMSYR